MESIGTQTFALIGNAVGLCSDATMEWAQKSVQMIEKRSAVEFI